MDGLSLAASVVAVIQIAGSCLKLSKKWVGPSEFCSSDLTTLTTTLCSFVGALKGFQTYLEIHEDDEARLNSLEYVKQVLVYCKESLDIILAFMENSGFIGKHLVGPRFDRKLKASLNALDRAKELFMLALHADQHTILLAVERYTRNVAEDLRDIRNDITEGIKRLREDGDEVFNEVKKARTEQQRWQDANSETTSHIKATVDRQDARGYSEERRAILNWLTAIDYATQQNDFIFRRQGGTGKWLLDSPEYQTWLQTRGQTLFCPGIPGAGKTILTSILVEDLCSRFRNDSAVGLAYVYFNFRQHEEQKPEDLLASLLKQLVESQAQFSVHPSVRELYESHKPKRTRPRTEELSRALQSVAAMYSMVYIVVDALDECQVADGCRSRFLSELFELRTKCQINIFATSRFIPEITERFEGSASLEIRANDDDVRKYLEGRISLSESSILKEHSKEVQTAIVTVVDGMFLLAQLHFDSIKTKKTLKKVRKALENLSAGDEAYYQAYQDAMDRIGRQDKDSLELAEGVLSWITYAKRPLLASELQHALAVEIGEASFDEDNLPQINDMISVCAGLVTVDNESGVIRLVHFTTQEYFEREQQRLFPHSQRDIAKVCVTYLCYKIFEAGPCSSDEAFEARLECNPLYDYAARHWGDHSRSSSRSLAAWMVLKEPIMAFLQNDAQVSGAAQAMKAKVRYYQASDYSQRLINGMVGPHIAAYFGLDKAVIDLLDIRYGTINVKDKTGRTPLSWAARNGHEAVVKLLLAAEEVNADPKDSYGRTPLSWAAKNGHEAVVKLLLAAKEVNANSKDRYDETPLSRAAEHGHVAVVKLLLAADGVDVDSKSKYRGQTPLSWAAENGHEAVVKLLLTVKGVNVDSKHGYGACTPFSLAAEHGHEAVVKLLLATEAVDINSKDCYDRSPLSWTAKNGHEAVVKLLLAAKNINVNSKDSYGGTPLLWAATNGHKAVVKLLLAAEGVNANSEDRIGRTPLFWAAQYGYKAIVKLLLAAGVNVHSKDRHGRTPLSLAAENGHEAVVKLLQSRTLSG